MGSRGPKPLPANVHVLRGNPSKKPVSQLLDQVTPVVEIPSCPSHLTPVARTEWRRIGAALRDLGLISKLDRAALAVYCQAYADWAWARGKINEANKADSVAGEAGMVGMTPSGLRRPSVYLRIAEDAVAVMHRFLCEFGMSPSARSRVTPSDLQPWLPGMDPGAQGAASANASGWHDL